MADYSSGLLITGDWSNIPMSGYQLRDNPLGSSIISAGEWSNIPMSGYQPRDNPMPGYLALMLPVPNTVTYYYAMRGKDNTGYKTWVATGTPDAAASQYTGTISGAMTDVVVLQSWTK